MQPPGHNIKKSVHYKGLGWAKGNQQNPPPNIQANNASKPHQPQYSQSYSPGGNNPMLQQNNSPFPTNNNNNNNAPNNRQRNFTTQNMLNPNMRNNMNNPNMMNPNNMRNSMPPNNMQQQQMRQMAQSMTAQQMRNSMNPQQLQINANRQQMRGPMNPNMRNPMPPQNKNNNNNNMAQPQHRKDKTKIFGADPSVPAPPSGPGANKKNKNNNNNPNNKGPAKNNRLHADSVDSMHNTENDDIYGNYSKNNRNTIANPSHSGPGSNVQKTGTFQPGMNRPNSLQPNVGHFKGASTGKLMPNQRTAHFKNTASTGQLGIGAMSPPTHRKEKTKIFGQDPSVPAPPGASRNNMGPNKSIHASPNAKPSQLTAQQRQQMNTIQKQNATYRQQQLLQQQNQSVRNVHGHQRQVQRHNPQGAWGPSHPYYKFYQQRMAMMRNQGGNPRANQYYQQWQQYYRRLMQNPQGQLQQMVMQQQQMIANLKRQLQERDKHYHKTIQTTINFKDMEINELREQINNLEEENDAIGELQMQNFRMKQELNSLRGDHQANVFDNLLDNMTSRAVSKSKVAWPGGPPGSQPNKSGKYPSPPTSATSDAGAKDPKAALNAMLKAKASPSEMLLTKTKTEQEKKLDNKDDGKYAKYAKMKKIGMPMVSIVNKMRMDGMSAQEIQEYTGEKIGGNAAEKEKRKGPKINLALPKYDKYKKMQKLKMPIKTILNRMKLDGLSEAERDAFSGKDSSQSSAERKKKSKLEEMRQLAQTLGLNPRSEVLPSKVPKMKRIHWDIIELSVIRKTFWWDLNKNSSYPEHIDLGGKFELDFQVRARKPRLNTGRGKIAGGLDAIAGGTGNKSGRKKGDRITWIGAKRDQSIQIALKRIGLPNEVIYDAIVDIDEEVMTLDLLEVIWDIAPTTDEQALAELKVDEIGDDMEFVGPSEMFHIEMSTIPEVKQQLNKWLFARTFREIYMDRLGQVNVMQKCANTIRHSIALQTYFRIILSMGNLMNHGTLKGIAYGYKLESVVKLLGGIKDYGGKKDLAMWLYQFSYNQFPETRSIFDELSQHLKKAKRLEITTIESSIVKMADEFTAIDLFMRRLNDDFHPGDTERFREYMNEFQDKQSQDMMNLKVKIQNATSICKQVAKFYSIELEDGKPEYLFIVIQKFIEILDSAKRSLLKLEKERLKNEQKLAAKREKERKKGLKNNKKGGGGLSINDRIQQKKQKAMDDEEKGNLLFLDIKNAANDFAKRQEAMAKRLESTLLEKKQLAKGQISDSAKKDAIKRRVSAQVMDNGNNSVGGLDMDEIKRLRAINIGQKQQESGNNNKLMVPGMDNMIIMEEQEQDIDINMMNNDDMKIDINNNNNHHQLQQQQQEEEQEDMNQDIDIQQIQEIQQQQTQQTNIDLNSAQWDDDDF